MVVSNVIFVMVIFLELATRIKAHLAGISGHDIVACVAMSQEVQKEAWQLKRLTKSLNVHHQAVLRREKSLQLHHKKLLIELSHRCLFSPNIVVCF